ncbi:GreA/GreB family elongation factor [Pseudoalteromonas xiamenensis]|uniref:GreA/GreB family elongation factor n=1 Tax=Pseudoalteromonas xiamenensis TaxID=882626 RepID=UPI0035EDF33B
MNKQAVAHQILFLLEQLINEAKDAADNARAGAVHEQSVAETQYDSLAIEAGYLAHGHSERADSLIKSYKEYESVLKISSDKVQVGSLIMLADDEETEYWYFLGPSQGGLKLEYKNRVVWTITPASPMGSKLVGREVGDEIVHTFANGNKLVTIEAVL